MAVRIHSRRSNPSSGFSLVEVTIALGIVGFSLLALVGSLPVGLRTTQDAQDQTTRARILRHLGGEAAQIPFSQLATYVSVGSRYFDNDGMVQDSPDGDSRYEVSLEQKHLTYPGSTNISELTNNGATIKVLIKRYPSGSQISIGSLSIPNIGE